MTESTDHPPARRRLPVPLIAALTGACTMALLWGAETAMMAVRPWTFPGVAGVTLLIYLLLGALLGGFYHGIFWRGPFGRRAPGDFWFAAAWATVGIHLFFRVPLFPRLLPDLASGTLVDDLIVLALWFCAAGELARLVMRYSGRPSLAFWLHGVLLAGFGLCGTLGLEPESLPGIAVVGGAVLASTIVAVWARNRRSWLLPAGCMALLVLVTLILGARLSSDILDPLPPSTSIPQGGPPVIQITIDTLRADSGFPSPQWLEENNAFYFDRCVCQATWTLPSTASLLTGRLPGDLGGVARANRLPQEAETIAERLASAGYHTAAFSDNRLISPVGGFAQGFAEFHLENGDDLLLRYPWFGTTGVLRQLVLRRMRLLYQGVDQLMPRVEAWLDQNHQQPFYLYLHLMDPHFPYYGFADESEAPVSVTWNGLDNQRRKHFDISVPLEGQQELRDRYAAEVLRTDEAIDDLVRCLRRLGLWDRCLLVINSDHGEEFFEHGSWGHGHTVRGEVSHVPLIIKPPLDPAAGSGRSSIPVQNLDLAPTILVAAGIDASDLPGTSLWPLIHGTQDIRAFERRLLTTVAFYPYPEPRHCFAVQYGNLKCIKRRTIQGTVTEWFDLQADPAEQQTLAIHPEGDEVRLMTEAIEVLAGRSSGSGMDRADPATREALKAMGYLQ